MVPKLLELGWPDNSWGQELILFFSSEALESSF